MGTRHTLTTAELTNALGQRGVELWFEGARLRFRAPKGALTPENRAELSARRTEIVMHLRSLAATSSKICLLSFNQWSLWFSQQQAPTSTAYNLAVPIEICSDLDLLALKQSLQALIDRHPALRTTYDTVDGTLAQIVAGVGVLTLNTHDVSGIPDDALLVMVENEYRRPFNLATGPIFRASLFTRRTDLHVLLLTIHHITVDGWSMLILIEELFELYAEATGLGASNLPRPTMEYTDYVRWREQRLAGPEADRLWSYWAEKLGPPLAQLDLPIDHPRPAASTLHGASVQLEFGGALTKKAKDLARRNGTTTFVVLLATFQVLLFRISGTEDVVVGTPVFGRTKPEFLRTVGNFVNSLAIRARLSDTMTFADLLAQLRQTVLEAIDAQELPFPMLVQRLQPKRESGRSPIFDTFFLFHHFEQFNKVNALLMGDVVDPIEHAGLLLRSYPIQQQEGQFELSLQLVEHTDGFAGAFMYRTDVFNEATIRRFADQYLALLDRLTGDPTITLGALLPIAAEPSKPDNDVGHLLDQLAQRDIRLSLDGDRLRINAPRGALDDQLKATIAALRDDVIARLRMPGPAAQDAGADKIRRIPRSGPLQVSTAQQRLWFLHQIDPNRSEYNIGGGLRYGGKLDIDVLRRAIRQLADRHESLRVSIGERDSEPWLRIEEKVETSVSVLDLSKDPSATREADAIRHAEALLRQPFDLARGQLAAFLIIRLSEHDHMLVASLHHIISDGWSLGVILGEICELYDAAMSGRPYNLPTKAVDYVDFAARERNLIKSGDFQRHLEYWKRQLEGIPAVLELPSDRPRPAIPSFRGGRLRHYLDNDLILLLETASRRHGVTLFMTLLAAWQVLLHLYSGQDDIVVGTPVANRDRPELEAVVGCLVNNVALRGKLNDNPSFSEFLEQIKQTTLSAFDHRELPFDMVVQTINPERNVSHAPIFQVLFALMSFPIGAMAPAGLSVDMLELEVSEARFDLAVEISPVSVGQHAGKYLILYEFSRDLYEEETIRRLHEHFENLLRSLASDPSKRIQEISLTLSKQDQRLLERWNATELPHDRRRCVHQLLEDTARRLPDAPAVTAGDVTLSYREFNRRANRLAHQLVQKGIGPGALVAVCLDRTVLLPIALAAVLKAGAAYVPLDPTHPTDRLNYMLEDAGGACVITLRRFAATFDAAALVLQIDDEGDDRITLRDEGPQVAILPEDLAYVIYTSGSTGRPKGVQVEHRNMVSFLEAMRREPGLTSGDVLLAVTTPAFDIAGLEFWLPLTVGAHVVIASRSDVLDGASLIDLVDEYAVSALQATPATWRLMLEAGWMGRRELKALCGGEALPCELAAMLIGCVGELWNMYGPTETTVWSTTKRVLDATGPISIGRPIANTRVHILDASGRPAPVGIVGELCIGGEGVARGYLNRPELTAEKFVDIVTENGAHERVYRTGDVARFRADGELEFLGRRDHQVKLRGYRIELGEIEAALANVPGVKQSVVIVREFGQGDERLVGYVTLQPDARFDSEVARAALRLRLPEYMVPNLFAVLPAMPLTPNGKLDRKALPLPGAGEPNSGALPEAVMTNEQRRVAAVWRDVLRSERIGLYENFFDIGGHSLLLVRLHAELKREFGNDFPLVELFQHTTVAAQANKITLQRSSQDNPSLRARARIKEQTHG
jgi:amino acid adenylation domain-containing protein